MHESRTGVHRLPQGASALEFLLSRTKGAFSCCCIANLIGGGVCTIVVSTYLLFTSGGQSNILHRQGGLKFAHCRSRLQEKKRCKRRRRRSVVEGRNDDVQGTVCLMIWSFFGGKEPSPWGRNLSLRPGNQANAGPSRPAAHHSPLSRFSRGASVELSRRPQLRLLRSRPAAAPPCQLRLSFWPVKAS